ncbi:MAG: hypothetical protein N3E37_04110 [Candidatus Micrarchaeota archaeon]|nr:hypothetical protein [Candidatus Micrarchaeota archaeon]
MIMFEAFFVTYVAFLIHLFSGSSTTLSSSLELLVGDPVSVSAMLVIGLLVIFISGFIAVLAYMAGRLFNNDKMIAFATSEIFECVYSALLVIITIAFFMSFNLVYEQIINSSIIGQLYPGICDLNSPNGYFYRSYVYDVSPTKYVYMEAVSGNSGIPGGMGSIIFGAIGLAGNVIGPVKTIVQSIINYFYGLEIVDSSGIKGVLDRYSTYSLFYKPRPEGGITHPVSGKPYPYPCHFAVANLFFDTLSWNIMYYLQDLISVYDKYAVFASVSLSLEAKNAANPYIGMNPIAFLEFVSASIREAIDLLGKMLNVTKLLQGLLLVLHIGIFPIGFILGFILRSFFLTRKIGGLILSIVVGLYMFYPLVFSFMFLLLSYIAEHDVVDTKEGINQQTALVLMYLMTNGMKPTKGLKEGTIFGYVHPMVFMLTPGLIFSLIYGGCNILDEIGNYISTKIKVFGNTDFGESLRRVISTFASTAAGSLIRAILVKVGAIASWVGIGVGVLLGIFLLLIYIIGLMAQGYVLGMIFFGYANVEPPIFMAGGIAEQTGIYLLYGGILTFLGILATIVFIKNYSPLLGGDKDIAGLARII